MFNEPVDGREDVMVAGDIIEGVRTVFLYPMCALMVSLMRKYTPRLPW